jgi:hypothetical protein
MTQRSPTFFSDLLSAHTGMDLDSTILQPKSFPPPIDLPEKEFILTESCYQFDALYGKTKTLPLIDHRLDTDRIIASFNHIKRGKFVRFRLFLGTKFHEDSKESSLFFIVVLK